MIALPCRPELTVGVEVTELRNLNTMEVIGSRCGRGHVAALDHQRQGGRGNGHRAKAAIRMV